MAAALIRQHRSFLTIGGIVAVLAALGSCESQVQGDGGAGPRRAPPPEA